MSNNRRHPTMDAAVNEELSNNRRHIPPEIVETILVRLPIKSLHRFSRVSKSWRSLISEPGFMKTRAAIRGVRRLLMSPHHDHNLVLADVSSCPLSSISSDSAVEDATPIIFPIEGKPILRASSGELWCVDVNNSLYLWNPSIKIYKKLPNPSLDGSFEYIYGLGYDSVSDDYKIFRLGLNYTFKHKSELYSLKGDSWKLIDYPSFLEEFVLPQKSSVLVGGALHFSTNYRSKTIISFDLATEKYGNVAPPPDQVLLPGIMEVSAFREKLCVHSCRRRYDGFGFRLVIWVMEEYGIEKSWTKLYDIINGNGISPDLAMGRVLLQPIAVTPLYLFDNGELLCRVGTYNKRYALFMYKGEETRPWKMICSGISDGFVYDEGFLSPLKVVKLSV